MPSSCKYSKRHREVTQKVIFNGPNPRATGIVSNRSWYPASNWKRWFCVVRNRASAIKTNTDEPEGQLLMLLRGLGQ